MAVAVWALKAIFYGLDPNNTGFARVDHILEALAQAAWPRDASASAVALVSEKTNDMGVVTAATAGDETDVKGDAGMLLDALRGLGVGVVSSPGTVNGTAGGCNGNCSGHGNGGSDRPDLVHYIVHLLDPRVSVDATSSSRRNIFRCISG